MIAMSTGMSTSTTHAPSRNLLAATSIATTPVVAAPMPLMSALRRHPRSVARCVYQRRTMPDWLSVKAMKTPTVYSGMSALTLPPNPTMRMMATAVSTTMPLLKASRSTAELEYPRQETVPREEAGQAREVGKGGIRGKDEQHRRGDLDQVVERRARAHESARQLADDRLLLGRIGHDAQLAGEEADAQEDQGEEAAHERDQDHARVTRLGRLEGRHAVSHGLGAGQRDRARGERAQDEQDAQPARRLPPPSQSGGGVYVGHRARGEAEQAVCEQAEDGDQVDVRRRAEDEPALANAAQVDEREERRTSTTPTTTRMSNSSGKIEVRAATPAAIDTATVST